nr:iron-sulfur cluster assembly accessory protein [Photobacterium jeanii]
MTWQGVTLTPSAAKQVASLTKAGQCFYLSVRTSGCTGYAYDIKMIEQPKDDDLTFESHGVTIFVALKAMPFVDGTEIDYVRQGLNQVFIYTNPNVKNVCGCGESFGV